MSAIQDIPVRRIDGTSTTLAEHAGKALLIVNVASQCGLTPQYTGLEALYEKFKDKGFAVLGFPANEFGAQEPGTNAEISEFCQLNYGVQFPMYEKIVVKGAGIHPLYQALTAAIPQADSLGDDGFKQKLASYGITQEQPSDVLWNFEKFLIDKSGKVVKRFAPNVTPDNPQLVSAVEAAIG